MKVRGSATIKAGNRGTERVNAAVHLSTETRARARVHVYELTSRGNNLIDRIECDADPDQRLWKPTPASWSLTEIVEHLSLVANGMLRVARPPALSPTVCIA